MKPNGPDEAIGRVADLTFELVLAEELELDPEAADAGM